MGYRHEMKYLLAPDEAEFLAVKLRKTLTCDPHAGKTGKYLIRSLYFDTPYERAVSEKVSGVEFRDKYRIRIYNYSDKTIKFERKHKNGSLIKKESVSLTRSQCEAVLAGARMAKERGITFDNAALDLFVHRVNENTRQIANELDKLDVYLGEARRKVTAEDVELMVAVSRNGVIFEISRAIENGNCRQAIRLVNEQLEHGEQGVTIMRAAIVPTVRNRFCARLLLDTYNLKADNYRAFESALLKLPPEGRKLLPLKKDGTPSCYGIFNAARTLARVPLKKARRDLQACADADRKMVSSGLEPRDILHKLIVMLTS